MRTVTTSAPGAMRVHEEFVYTLGADEQHGFRRYIPYRVPYDDARYRVYRFSDIRVEASDVAGNVGSAVCPEPITITASRVVGRLGGLRTLPAAAAPAPPALCAYHRSSRVTFTTNERCCRSGKPVLFRVVRPSL